MLDTATAVSSTSVETAATARLCAACGDPVPPMRRDTGGTPKKYCSASCRHWAHQHPGQRREHICHRCQAATPQPGRRFCSPCAEWVRRGVCQRCGGKLPDDGVPRKWCSARCRERHSADRFRVELEGYDDPGTSPPVEPEELRWLMGGSARALPDDLRPLPSPPAWQADAACFGMPTALWFPPQGHSAAAGLEVCERCPVRVECGTWAITEGFELGTFGGLTAKARRPLLDRRFGADLDEDEAA